MDFESIFGAVLFQTSWHVFTLILAVGVILFLLPFYIEKLGQSRAQRFTNFLALVAILIGSINAGYWASDRDWGRNKVNQDRQEEIQNLQSMSHKR